MQFRESAEVCLQVLKIVSMIVGIRKYQSFMIFSHIFNQKTQSERALSVLHKYVGNIWKRSICSTSACFIAQQQNKS